MAADPQIFKPEALPGKLKHTFTTIRRSFPNIAMHAIIGQIFLYRRELVARPEFQATVAWHDQLVTWVHNALTSIGVEIDHVTYRGSSVVKPLRERNELLLKFVDTASSKDTSIEDLANQVDATHEDQLLPPVAFRNNTIAIDLDGTDPDYPQPTPARIKNVAGRQLIIGLDGLIVTMTRSQSADLASSINRWEAAFFKSRLADLYALATERGGNDRMPHVPTAMRRSELDGSYNADGALDPSLHDVGQPADQDVDLGGLK